MGSLKLMSYFSGKKILIFATCSTQTAKNIDQHVVRIPCFTHFGIFRCSFLIIQTCSTIFAY